MQKKEYIRTLGIFVINHKGELLLNKAPHPNTAHGIWQAPHFEQNTLTSSPLIDAQRYLDQLGIECDLHEVFIPPSALNGYPEPIIADGHIIIAIARQQNARELQAPNLLTWMPLHHIVRHAHQKPAHYTAWFRNALDGVSLYLKNLLEKQTTTARHYTLQ